MKRLLAAVLIAVVAAPGAIADIGVRLDRTSARPHELVLASSANCCFLPLYLVPARLVPTPHTCGSNRICEPSSLGPPRRAGWTWLGRFFPHRASFRFRVPEVRPGLYRAVVYCAPCFRGPRGSLIAGEQLLRVSR